MRAVAIEGFGGADHLEIVNPPVPEPGPDDVLVRVRAAGGCPVAEYACGRFERCGL